MTCEICSSFTSQRSDLLAGIINVFVSFQRIVTDFSKRVAISENFIHRSIGKSHQRASYYQRWSLYPAESGISLAFISHARQAINKREAV